MKQKSNKINLFPLCSLNEMGGRGNNEDSIFPAKGKANEKDRLFLVCDGVGGQHKGEEASALLCREIPEYFNRLESAIISETDALQSLKYAEHKMDEHVKSYPECKKMASTLTFLYFNNDNVYAMWVGDSRIYQIRNGEIIFKSKDHSLVNHLVELGEITEEEALHHPQKNMILKAVSPGVSVKPDIVELADVQTGDFFFMCTDGILENLTDDLLKQFCNEKQSCNEIKEAVYKKCYGKTKDNFSCNIIQVKNSYIKTGSGENKKSKSKFSFLLAALALVLVLLISMLILFKHIENRKENHKMPHKPKVETSHPTNKKSEKTASPFQIKSEKIVLKK